MRPKIIFELNTFDFPINITQVGKDRFISRYGLEEKKGEYETVAKHVGFAIMHALNIAGKITP